MSRNDSKIDFEKLIDIAWIILANATVIPDPAMKGSTDTYSVPLDDIDNLREILEGKK